MENLMNMKKPILVILTIVFALAFIACDNDNGSETHTHDYGTAWQSDATQHWKECTANDGAKSEVANHDYDTDYVCTVCEYEHTHTGDPCSDCGYDGKAALYGTWIKTEGMYQPYTLTITADTIKIEDKDGDYIQYADVQWGVKTANTNADYSTDYPNGYTFTGTRTNQLYSSTGNFAFVALSTDGQSVYVGENASTKFNLLLSGPIYTKQ
jgi:hypothetical protein